MILILCVMCGLGGAVVGGLACVAWGGAAMVFGFAPPTEDQVNGMVMLFGSATALGSAGLFVGVLIYEDYRASRS